MHHTPKYRWRLNEQQIEVLNLLYKFRFATSDLIAVYFGKKNGSYVYKRLSILHEQKFIGKRFDGKYRIQGKPAVYYLTPNGMRMLNEARIANGREAINPALYKEQTVSEGFVQYCLGVLDIYCKLRASYGERLYFATQRQLAAYDYFSDFTPSIYMRITSGNHERDYFIECIQTGKPLFAAIKRMGEYIEYADSGEWQDATGSDFPNLLLFCDTPVLRKRLKSKLGDRIEDPEFEVRVMSRNELLTL